MVGTGSESFSSGTPAIPSAPPSQPSSSRLKSPVAEAMEFIRLLRLRTDVTLAYDAWTNNRESTDATQALADAVSAWANRHPTP